MCDENSYPSYFQGIKLAFLFSLFAALFFSFGHDIVSLQFSFSFIVTITGFGYAIFLLFEYQPSITREQNTNNHAGKLSMIGVISITALLMLLLPVPLFVLLAVPLSFVWFVRVFYYHRQFILAVLDALLIISSLVISFTVAQRTDNIFLTLWSFYLIQSSWILLPKITRIFKNIRQKIIQTTTKYDRSHLADSIAAFEQAEMTAIAAIKALSPDNLSTFIPVPPENAL